MLSSRSVGLCVLREKGEASTGVAFPNTRTDALTPGTPAAAAPYFHAAFRLVTAGLTYHANNGFHSGSHEKAFLSWVCMQRWRTPRMCKVHRCMRRGILSRFQKSTRGMIISRLLLDEQPFTPCLKHASTQ